MSRRLTHVTSTAALGLACLAFTGHGHGLQISGDTASASHSLGELEQTQSHARGFRADPLLTLATLLVAVEDTAAVLPGIRQHVQIPNIDTNAGGLIAMLSRSYPWKSSPSLSEFRDMGIIKEEGEPVSAKGAAAQQPKKLKPFRRGKPQIVMDKAIERVLSRGGVWCSTKVMDRVGIGQAVFDVEASPAVVWNQVFDFPSWPKKVPMMVRAEVYKRKVEGNLGRTFVKHVTRVFPGVRLTYHQEYTYEPAKSAISWTLDDRRKNNVHEVQGHWHIMPLADDSSKTRVFFEVAGVFPRWLPMWLINKLAKTAVKDQTAWIKKYSERAR